MGGALSAHPFLVLLSADATWGRLSAHACAHFKSMDTDRGTDRDRGRDRDTARGSEERIEPIVDASRENVVPTKGKKRNVAGDEEFVTTEWPAIDADQGDRGSGDQRSSEKKKRKKVKKIATMAMDGEVS